MGVHHGKHERPWQQEERQKQVYDYHVPPQQQQQPFPSAPPPQQNYNDYYYLNDPHSNNTYPGLQVPNMASPQQPQYIQQQPQVVYVMRDEEGGCGSGGKSRTGGGGCGSGHQHQKMRFGC